MKRGINIFLSLLILILLFGAIHVNGSSIEELQRKISEKSTQIKDLEKEIADSQKELSRLGGEVNDLSGAIRILDATRKKLTADLALTGRRIENTNLEIEKLELEITNRGNQISIEEVAISDSIISINNADEQSLVELILTYDNLTEFWDNVESIKQFQLSLRNHVITLKNIKANLEADKKRLEAKRLELNSLRITLADQKKIVEANQKQKDALLKITRNKAAEYKKLLAEQVAKRDAFEQELLEFESELSFEIDPTRLPETGSGILKWPLGEVFITQYFGNTSFAKKTLAYNGQGHNGIDLRASVGTPAKAALGGKVAGTGDTDTVCPSASYGKWVLITHSNGLSTLYAHLSLIKVTEGQEVATGEMIGYTGNTGYSTGPHLHFTVYASQGMRILEKRSRVCQGIYRMPVADLKAYLNPLLYL